MIRFEQPLWFLLLIPALCAAAFRIYLAENRTPALIYPGTGKLRTYPRRRRIWLRWTPAVIKLLVLALGVCAMARPQTIDREFAGPAEGIDILMALDTSVSMRALDFDPLDRMAAAKNAAGEFIQGRVSDRIGILVFGGAPLLMCPLTLDYEALREFLRDVEAGMTQTQGTAIGDGIASAVNHLKGRASKSKVIILLTDGRSNVDAVDPLTAAKTARTFGIKIHTIGTAQRGPARIPVNHPIFGRQLQQIADELDEDTLLRVAAETGGKYFRATSLKELSSIYSEIDRMEKTEYERPEIVTRKDHLLWFLVPGAVLLGLEMLLSGTLLMRIP